ncbi:MAG: class D sortase [Clostridiales bacterium]|jgi:sortase A|nr:class D sortase [Clostridiales bacterium]
MSSRIKAPVLVSIGSLLAAAGLIAIFSIQISSIFYEKNKNELLGNWREQIEANPPSDRLSITLAKVGDIILGEDNLIQEKIFSTFNPDRVVTQVTGIIKIPKINLEAPILTGVSARNLDIGIVELLGSQPMGHAGNYCLAGHSSRAKGRHFNRLPELTYDDEVILFDGVFSYKYKVYNIVSVSPDDPWPLQNVDTEAIITLTTCDYASTPTARLVIQARLADTQVGE